MRVYISVDMEGIAGVVHWADTKLEGVEYERARRWRTDEANAAMEGALKPGPTQVGGDEPHRPLPHLPGAALPTERCRSRGRPTGAARLRAKQGPAGRPRRGAGPNRAAALQRRPPPPLRHPASTVRSSADYADDTD